MSTGLLPWSTRILTWSTRIITFLYFENNRFDTSSTIVTLLSRFPKPETVAKMYHHLKMLLISFSKFRCKSIKNYQGLYEAPGCYYWKNIFLPRFCSRCTLQWLNKSKKVRLFLCVTRNTLDFLIETFNIANVYINDSSPIIRQTGPWLWSRFASACAWR